MNADIHENATAGELPVPAEVRAAFQRFVGAAEATGHLLQATEPALVKNPLQHPLVRAEAHAVRRHETGTSLLGCVEYPVEVPSCDGLLAEHVNPLQEEERR